MLSGGEDAPAWSLAVGSMVRVTPEEVPRVVCWSMAAEGEFSESD